MKRTGSIKAKDEEKLMFGLNIDSKITLLIMLWVIDKLIILAMFFIFRNRKNEKRDR